MGALDGIIADVVAVNAEFAKRQGIDPHSRSTKPIVKKILQDLDQKHARKLKQYDDRTTNDKYKRGPRTRSVAEAYSPPAL